VSEVDAFYDPMQDLWVFRGPNGSRTRITRGTLVAADVAYAEQLRRLLGVDAVQTVCAALYKAQQQEQDMVRFFGPDPAERVPKDSALGVWHPIVG
jgi:hypothetical protein